MALTALQTDFKLRWSSSHSRISQQVFFNYNILFSCQRTKHLWVSQSRRHSLSCERYWRTQRTRSLRWLNSLQTTWPSLHPEWNFVCFGWICGYYESPWKNQHLERETSSQIFCIIDGFDINWAQVSIVPLNKIYFLLMYDSSILMFSSNTKETLNCPSLKKLKYLWEYFPSGPSSGLRF